uniref:Uncharacterized protein n=1 Tax=Aegilops tauschii TaxID=37682 RepID=M8BRA3_AEGTA
MDRPNRLPDGPEGRFYLPAANREEGYRELLGCRDGLVLILHLPWRCPRRTPPASWRPILVWDPVSGDKHRIAFPWGFDDYKAISSCSGGSMGRSQYSILRADDRGLGFLFLLKWDYRAVFYDWKTDRDGVSSWVNSKLIEIDKLLSLNAEKKYELLCKNLNKECTRMLGFAENSNVIFLETFIGLFMIELSTLQLKELPRTNGHRFNVHAFESVYTAAARECMINASPMGHARAMQARAAAREPGCGRAAQERAGVLALVVDMVELKFCAMPKMLRGYLYVINCTGCKISIDIFSRYGPTKCETVNAICMLSPLRCQLRQPSGWPKLDASQSDLRGNLDRRSQIRKEEKDHGEGERKEGRKEEEVLAGAPPSLSLSGVGFASIL